MAVSFSDEINPQKLLSENVAKIQFKFWSRPIQYLEYFGIISVLEYKFHPLNLKFKNYDELKQYLFDRGIVYHENTISETFPPFNTTDTNHYVDLTKIYGQEIDLETHVLQHKFYSVNEIAGLLSFSRPTVYKLIRDGELKAIRINNQLRIKHSDYVDYVTAPGAVT